MGQDVSGAQNISAAKRPMLGGCQCGALRYGISGAPIEIYVCHCTQCRRQSSSAFGISVIVAADGLRLISGEPACWSRPTASGGTLDCHFCPDCGSRVWHRKRGDDRISVKGGTLDEAADLSDVRHIRVREKLPGVAIPDHVARFDGEPS